MIPRAVIIGAVLATPALAQDATVEAMVTAIEDAGCVVTADNGDAVLAATGLDEQQTMAVIAALYEAGRVDLQADGTLKLTSEACP